ncbi:MAG: right-handed parallel beta-helix repeat-containing protein [Planctomycetota bacterium]
MSIANTSLRSALALLGSMFGCLAVAAQQVVNVSTAAELIDAVSTGQPFDTVMLAAGTYELNSPLQPPQGMTIAGDGAASTFIRSAPGWVVGTAGLPDNPVDHTSVDRNAYLIDVGTRTDDITIEGITLSAPDLHGAVYGNNCDRITIRECIFDDFLWSAVRLFRVDDGRIHDNEFIDAGGRSAITTGQTGGALFLTFTNTTDIWNNRFTKTPDHPGNFFGIKGRNGADVRIFNNTINVSFSIEFPFENERNFEIFANYLAGVVSIPKFAGGPDRDIGESFVIRNNYFSRSYSIEGPRNGLLIESNLFDFSTTDDGGNLIASFGNNNSPVAPGPTVFRGNNVKNPGRGLFWSAPIYNAVQFSNNHIITNTTVTPRSEGLFGFKLSANNSGDVPDLSSLQITDNIIEMNGLSRPLIRNGGSADISAITIENNSLVNVADAGSYANTDTGAPRGPLVPLRFFVGVGDEFLVDGFSIEPSPSGCQADVNGDGDATPADFNAWVITFNGQLPACDQNSDSACTPADFNAWVVNFNAGC